MDVKNYGECLQDDPINSLEKDKLDMRRFANSMITYIKNCTTPTTVVVNGNAGMGKTSFMYMIRNELNNEESYSCMYFNSTQYVQFGEEKNLSLSFLTIFLKELGRDELQEASSLKWLRQFGKNLAYNVMLSGLEKIAGNEVKEALETTYNDFLSEMPSSSEQLWKIKKEIEEYVKTIIDKKKKIIVFVDDLDYLAPNYAVELLEVIKTFLNCEGCIFLVAIDNSLIYHGLAQKYRLQDEGAENMYNKLIQVTLDIPVVHNYKAYIESLLPDSCEILKNRKEDLIEVLRYASDDNPRNMKELIRSFMVFMGAQAIKTENEKNKEILLISFCLQKKLHPLYHKIITLSEQDFKNWLRGNLNLEVSEEELRGIWGYSKKKIKKFNKTKIEAAEVLIIFRKWCNESYSENNDVQKNLVSFSMNRFQLQDSQVNKNAMLLIQGIISWLAKKRRKLVWKVLLKENGKKSWVRDARKYLYVDENKRNNNYKSNNKIAMLLTAQMNAVDSKTREYICQVLDLYQAMGETAFWMKYNYEVETIGRELGYNIGKYYNKCNRLKKIIKQKIKKAEKYGEQYGFDKETIRTDILLLKWRGKDKELFTDEEINGKSWKLEIYYELSKRIEYLLYRKIIWKKENIIFLREDAPRTVFSTIIKLENNSTNQKVELEEIRSELVRCNWDMTSFNDKCKGFGYYLIIKNILRSDFSMLDCLLRTINDKRREIMKNELKKFELAEKLGNIQNKMTNEDLVKIASPDYLVQYEKNRLMLLYCTCCSIGDRLLKERCLVDDIMILFNKKYQNEGELFIKAAERYKRYRENCSEEIIEFLWKEFMNRVQEAKMEDASKRELKKIIGYDFTELKDKMVLDDFYRWSYVLGWILKVNEYTISVKENSKLNDFFEYFSDMINHLRILTEGLAKVAERNFEEYDIKQSPFNDFEQLTKLAFKICDNDFQTINQENINRQHMMFNDLCCYAISLKAANDLGCDVSDYYRDLGRLLFMEIPSLVEYLDNGIQHIDPFEEYDFGALEKSQQEFHKWYTEILSYKWEL